MRLYSIFEALSGVKQMAREGRMRESRGATFVWLLKRSEAVSPGVGNRPGGSPGHVNGERAFGLAAAL